MLKRKIHFTRFLFFIFSLFFLFPSISSSRNVTDNLVNVLRKSPKLKKPDLVLKDFLQGHDVTRVMVGLREPADAMGIRKNLRNLEARDELRKHVQAAREMVADTLNRNEVRIRNTYHYLFGFAAEVTLQGLQDLINSPDVLFIHEDREVFVQSAQGIPLMNALAARNAYDGSGLAIAVCDTGIDYTHANLGGGGFPNSKVIGGFDFGDNDGNPMDLNGHGTACAGIAAGDLGTVGDYIGGVAPGAKLYALKISFGNSGSAFLSDIASAWDWCVLHQYEDLNNPILIISTSFGEGRYSGNCDEESPLVTQAAANAMAAGMTLFIASGNNGYCDSMNYPACLDSVISVGAVYDADIDRNPPNGQIGCISYGSCTGTVDPEHVCEKLYIDYTTKADQVCTYSNSSKWLSLLAPANWATTTKRGGGYWDTANGFGGTSAACPYAAGAAACLQSAAKAITGSYLTHHQVKSTLLRTGDPVTDGKVDITKSRVNLGLAVTDLLAGMKVTPSSDLSSQGNLGGSFSPASIVYALENQTDSGIYYSVSKGTPWVSISHADGFLPAHTTTNVTVWINAEAFLLQGGIHTDAINFINTTTNRIDATRRVTLTVIAPTLQYSYRMNSNPGWTTEGLWAWGQPTGGGGQHGSPDPTSGYTGSAVYGYNLSGDYENDLSEQHLTTEAFDCSKMSQVTLKFRRWLGVEENAFDHASVQVSTDGNTWSPVWENSSSVTDSEWVLQSFDISTIADGYPTVYIRWTMGATNTTKQYCGWNIDDVEIWAVYPTSFPPTVETAPVSSITSTGASSGGNVTLEGSSPVTARGVCWSTVANPSVSGDKTSNGTGAGSFTGPLAGLLPGTTYHVRAYATNGEATAYGRDLGFNTAYTVVLYVNSSGDCDGKTPCYSAIQQAVNNAAAGSAILIAEGHYDESLTFNEVKGLSLIGGLDASFTVKTSNSTVNSIEIGAPSIVVDNLGIR